MASCLQRWGSAIVVLAMLTLLARTILIAVYIFDGWDQEIVKRTIGMIESGELTNTLEDVEWGCVDTKIEDIVKSEEPLDPDFFVESISFTPFGPYVTGIIYPYWLTIAMHFVVNFLLLCGVGYGLSTLCRPSYNGAKTYLYYSPRYIPLSIYVLISVNSIITTVDVYLVSWLYIWPSLLLSFASLVILSIALWTGTKALRRKRKALKKIGRSNEMNLAIALLHNSIAFALWWILMVFHQKLAVTLVFFLNLGMNTAGYLVLGIALGFILFQFLLENVIAYKKFRYIYGSYIAWIISFAAMLLENWDTTCGVVIMMLVVFATLLLMFFIKICVFCFRNENKKRRAKEKAKKVKKVPVCPGAAAAGTPVLVQRPQPQVIFPALPNQTSAVFAATTQMQPAPAAVLRPVTNGGATKAIVVQRQQPTPVLLGNPCTTAIANTQVQVPVVFAQAAPVVAQQPIVLKQVVSAAAQHQTHVPLVTAHLAPPQSFR